MPPERGTRVRRAAASVALVYAVLGALWILSSDWLLLALVDGDANRLARLQTWKGWFFVAITAALLYVLVRRAIESQAQSERALQKQRELLHLFYTLPFVGMALTSPHSRRWRVANPRLCEILGYAADELTTKTWSELTHPDDLAADLAQFEHMLAGEIDGYEMDKRFVRKDGVVVHTTINIRCVRDADGSVRDVLATVHDVTRHKEAEEAVQALNVALEQRVAARTAELEAANRELESFAYTVSHDLKAPLRGIDGYSRILLEDYRERLDEDGRKVLANVRRSVAQMHALIDDMLAYSRMERCRLEIRPVELAALVRAAVAGMPAAAGAGGGRIEQRVPPLQVRVDPDGLMLVLRNLIENGLKFSRGRADALVSIGAESCDGCVRLWVRDNGVGFDMQYHDRIFEMFRRLHRGDEYPGTGIGLALVKKAVQRMGGRVWAHSAPGQGATFFVELPQ
jgi:PAS domain S-box-containing protein